MSKTEDLGGKKRSSSATLSINGYEIFQDATLSTSDKPDYGMTFYAIYNRFFSWPLRVLLLLNILFPIVVVLDRPDTDRIPALASAFLWDMMVFGLPVVAISVICLFLMLIREIHFSRDTSLLINENKPNLGILMLDLILLTFGALVAGIYGIFIYFSLTLSFRSSV